MRVDLQAGHASNVDARHGIAREPCLDLGRTEGTFSMILCGIARPGYWFRHDPDGRLRSVLPSRDFLVFVPQRYRDTFLSFLTVSLALPAKQNKS